MPCAPPAADAYSVHVNSLISFEMPLFEVNLG